MATPSSFIVIYNVVSLQWEIITTILPRERRIEKRADLDRFHRGLKVLDTVWISLLERVLKNRWLYQTVSTVINRCDSTPDLLPFFRKYARIATWIGWEFLFCTIGYESESSRLSFKCDSDCWSIPEDEEKENGIFVFYMRQNEDIINWTVKDLDFQQFYTLRKTEILEEESLKSEW